MYKTFFFLCLFGNKKTVALTIEVYGYLWVNVYPCIRRSALANTPRAAAAAAD